MYPFKLSCKQQEVVCAGESWSQACIVSDVKEMPEKKKKSSSQKQKQNIAMDSDVFGHVYCMLD